MRFVCDSCRAQYMISDEKVGPKGVKVRCKKCGYVILVKKADPAAAAPVAKMPSQPQPPVPLSNDPDDALATQVMQNPLDGPPTTVMGRELGDATAPGLGINEEKTSVMPAQGGGAKAGFDASEDEIGAVFDQVLNSGAHSIPKPAREEKTELENEAVGGSERPEDDRLSTRVVDAHVVKKLAEDAAGDEPAAKNGSNGSNGNGHADKAEVPKTDWFVAIDDKQTGPLTLEKLKEHWERGEVGPDSLCWRAGFSDWVPVSEVADLAFELAPRPTKPVVVAPVTVGGTMPGPVVSVPVESAFSAGGVMKSVRSEVQVPLAAAGPEETGTWRPSAASALASLVKEEMEALAKPAAAAALPPVDVADAPLVSAGGLLSDLPEASQPMKPKVNGNGHAAGVPLGSGAGEMTAAHGPRNPYIANPGATYSSPAVSQYRPERGPNTTLIAILVLGGVAVLGIVAFVIVSVMRPAQPVVVQQPAQPPPAVNGQPNNPPANAQPSTNVPTGAGPQPTTAQVAGTAPAANGTTQVAANSGSPQPASTTGTPAKREGAAVAKVTAPPKARDPAEKPAPREKPEPAEKPDKKTASAEPKGGEDEFSKAFGGGGDEKKAAKGAEKPADDSPKKKTVYVPDAPGAGGNIPETLGQADIMEVVKGNITSIKKCVDEQKAKEPGTSGKLVMKWTIQTSGKTSRVDVVSDEFKSTYLAGCVGGLIKTWQFPKHKTQGEPVVFPFKF